MQSVAYIQILLWLTSLPLNHTDSLPLPGERPRDSVLSVSCFVLLKLIIYLWAFYNGWLWLNWSTTMLFIKCNALKYALGWLSRQCCCYPLSLPGFLHCFTKWQNCHWQNRDWHQHRHHLNNIHTNTHSTQPASQALKDTFIGGHNH